MDQVQAANSGHPGMPMGAADYTACLFLNHLKYSPDDMNWPDRDRFVLSAGHGSALLYSVLHLIGVDLPVEELKAFRQFGSLTPGHPEHGHTPGVETTTGPLGNGCANAVGMALAERMLAARFNTEDFSPVDHYTYLLCSDGDLMEGISHEAFSLAGHLGLNRLIAIYDSNRITIEGSTDLAYSDDVRSRFKGYHWNVKEIDGHDCSQIQKALAAAKRSKKPTLIIANTHIAQGSPNLHDSSKAHGEPLGEDEVRATRRNLGLPEALSFHVPDDVRELFALRRAKMGRAAKRWHAGLRKYRAQYPEKAAEWDRYMAGSLPENLQELLPSFDKPIATRAASGKMIQSLAKAIPWLVGGSADLAPSNKTRMTEEASVSSENYGGRNLHFGIREHAMAGIMNGMALHGGFRVFGATFLVFLDYCRPAVRLGALMGLPITYVFTHDSFYVGEDGPTHQPIEQLASLRCMPNVTVIRPADATETVAAWVAALKNTSGPTALLLTRQNLPVLDRSIYPPAAMLEKGAYTLWQNDPDPQVVLLASGSEVPLALEAAQQLAAEHKVRVVSMPSWELFEKQDVSYRNEVIPSETVRIAIEAGCSFGWERYVGATGRVIGITHYGASGPADRLATEFGFTVEQVVSAIRSAIAAG
jgi:transketolase